MSIRDRDRWVARHGDVTTKEEQMFYDALPPVLKNQCVRQKKIVEGRNIYFLDFFFIYASLCVEIDGSAHIARRDKDKKRDAYLLNKGIKTIRFSNSQITDKQSLERIISYLVSNYT